MLNEKYKKNLVNRGGGLLLEPHKGLGGLGGWLGVLGGFSGGLGGLGEGLGGFSGWFGGFGGRPTVVGSGVGVVYSKLIRGVWGVKSGSN